MKITGMLRGEKIDFGTLEDLSLIRVLASLPSRCGSAIDQILETAEKMSDGRCRLVQMAKNERESLLDMIFHDSLFERERRCHSTLRGANSK
jgi:hypothetical protein